MARRPLQSCALILTGLFAISSTRLPAAESEPTSDDAAVKALKDARLRSMRELAEAISVEAVKENAAIKLGLVEDARFRFNSPTIACDDATVWVWGRTGRPAAVLTLSGTWPTAGRDGIWSYEFTSLSPSKLRATNSGDWEWTPQESGVEFQDVPNAPPPSDSATRRLGQMKDIARRFGGFALYNGKVDKPSRFRVLPTPLHRYDDPDAGVLDGAMFVVAVDTNPEALLLIELVKAAPNPIWKFGVNRVSMGEIHATLDEKEVWKSPPGGQMTSESRYFIVMRRMSP